MANENRLIDANKLAETYCDIDKMFHSEPWDLEDILAFLNDAPTIEAAPVNNNPCGFCGKFNFGNAKAEVYSHGANIVIASALTRFPVEEQFNFCPVCGRRVKKGGASND